MLIVQLLLMMLTYAVIIYGLWNFFPMTNVEKELLVSLMHTNDIETAIFTLVYMISRIAISIVVAIFALYVCTELATGIAITIRLLLL